jgi:hypothetical protein
MKFATCAVVSVSSGRFLGDLDGMYGVMSFLMGRPAYTHELAYYAEAASKALMAAVPGLPDKKAARRVNQSNYQDFLLGYEEEFGKKIDLPESLGGCLADDKNPLSTIEEMTR